VLNSSLPCLIVGEGRKAKVDGDGKVKAKNGMETYVNFLNRLTDKLIKRKFLIALEDLVILFRIVLIFHSVGGVSIVKKGGLLKKKVMIGRVTI